MPTAARVANLPAADGLAVPLSGSSPCNRARKAGRHATGAKQISCLIGGVTQPEACRARGMMLELGLLLPNKRSKAVKRGIYMQY